MVATMMTSQATKMAAPVMASSSRMSGASAPRAFSGFKPAKSALLTKSADASLSQAVAARVAVQVRI